MERCHHHGTPQKERSDRVRQLQGHLAGSARRQDTAEDHRSPPQRALRVRGDPAGGTEWFPTERVGILLEEQSGFRPNRFTTDMMFVIRRLQELARKNRIPLYVSFIDLTKAYGSIDRTLLWTVLARFGVPQNMISVISSIPRWHASMRAARRQGVLEVVRCGIRPSSRVRARAPPIHLFRGGYKRGLHAFQGGQRHHGRFGTPEEEKGGGGKQLPESQSSRRCFGACFMLTMPGSSRNHPSS